MKGRTLWKLEKFSYRLGEILKSIPVSEDGETIVEMNIASLRRDIDAMINEDIEVRKNRNKGD